MLSQKGSMEATDDQFKFTNDKLASIDGEALFYMALLGSHGQICQLSLMTREINIIKQINNCSMPNEVAIADNSKVYLMDSFIKSFKIFDISTKEIHEGTPPPKWRQRACVGFWMGKLFYIGGFDEKLKPCNCVNIYEDEKWIKGPDFPITISNGVSVVCVDKLYVFDDLRTKSIFELSLDMKEWIEVGTINKNRWPSTLTVHNDEIYITTRCSRFNPNAPKEVQNNEIAKMKYPRQEHSIVSANGKLYAIGGYRSICNHGGGFEFCTEIEEYDPDPNKWTVIGYCEEPKKECSTATKCIPEIIRQNHSVECTNLKNFPEEKCKQAIGENVIVKNETCIGIDLGTTYSRVAVVENGQPTVIYSDYGENIVPSVVAYSEKEVLVGNPAVICNTDLSNILYDSKRLIGWHIVNNLPNAGDRQLWTFNVDTRNNCAGYVLNKGKSNEKFLKPEEVSAEILKNLKVYAEKYLSKGVTGCVVTVPAIFTEQQLAATKRAVEMAGLNLIGLLHESTAAAIAYNQKNELDNSAVLLFDWGGGTLDVTIAEMRNDQVSIKAVSGDFHLGGQDIDARIMKFVNEESKKSHGYDIFKKANLIKRLRQSCREAKKSLSFSITSCNIQMDIGEKDLNVKLSIEKLHNLCRDIFEKAMNLVDQALNTARMTADSINHVILVGGTTRMPIIQQLLEKKFGKSKLKFDINPNEAVALGAAIYANSTQLTMTEQSSSSNPTFYDNFSTNPVDPNPPLPDFITELNVQQQTLIESVWNSDTLTLSKKIACIDELSDKMAKETRREYRRWRFEHDKSSVNAFLEKQNPAVQNHIRSCLSSQPNLDRFCNAMLALLPSFDDKESFISWANSEMLQWNGILFYLLYGEKPNYEGRICLFNSSTFEVEIVEKFSTPVNPCGVAIGNDQIFVISGFFKVFEIFNYETKQLTKGPDPLEWSDGATVAYYKNKLYYIGGRGSNDQDLTSVNILVDGKWQQGTDFPIEVMYARHVICNGKLYIISINAVFQLSDDEREWIEVGKMNGERWNPAIASLNGKIYITGGEYNDKILNFCLCFDPSQPPDRRFTSIANMHFKRCHHSLVVANEKLYAIGGYQKDGYKEFCKSVEEYDSTTNQWRISNNNLLLDIKSPSINDTKSSDIPSHNDNETVVATPNYRQDGKASEYNGTIIGIDFGTTNSSCAVFRNGKAEMIPDDESDSFLIPSVVSFEDDGITLVGKDAAETLQNRHDPQNVIYDLKRFMGHQYDNEELQVMKRGWPFQIVEQKNHPYILIVNNDCEERLISPIEAARYIFEKLKLNAETYLEKTINSAVIGIPASFNENQKVAIGAAAELAGLRNLEFVVEPNAAALAYDINLHPNSKTVLFHDFGGGTLDISIIRYDTEVVPLSAVGDSHLGGNDIDIKIANYFMNQYDIDIIDESKRFPRDKHDIVQRLIFESRRAKEAVSNKNGAVKVHLLHVFNNIDLENILTSEIFNALCEETITRIEGLIDNALESAQLTANEIDQVVLVGGSSRIPSVRKLVENKFGREKLLTRNRQLQQLPPEHAIALGAAVRAHELEQQMSDVNEDTNTARSESPDLNLKFFNAEKNMGQVVEASIRRLRDKYFIKK